MCKAEEPIIKNGAGVAGLFSTTCPVFEEYLGSHRKDRSARKAGQQGLKKIRIHNHVVVQQHDNVCVDRLNPAVVAANETIVSIEFKNSNLRECFANKSGTAVL